MKKMRISRINPNDPSHPHHKKPNFVAHEKQSPKATSKLERQNFTTCDPKTSEYAFFKKLKKDASLSFKKPEFGDCSKERTDDVGVGTKGCNSSRIIQDMSTFKMDSFLSPSVEAWNKSDLYSISSMPKKSQGCSDTLKPQSINSHGGNQYEDGDIFSRKRKKLRQCVADALFPDTENLCSKGFDIVSVLLSRLFPLSTDCAVKNKHDDPNPGKIESAARYDLLDYRESDVEFKEHYPIPKRKLLELESGSYFSDQLLSPMFLELGERITSHPEFPTYHSQNFQPPYSITEPKCKLSGSPSFSGSVKGDLTLGFRFNEVENDTKYSLLYSREFDFQCTELHQTPKRKLLELESSSHFSDHLLSPMFLRTVELITPDTDFPIYLPEFRPVFRTEVESIFGGTPSYLDKNDLNHGFLCNKQKHEIFTLEDHFKELGKLESEPIPLLMGREFDNTDDEINLPIVSKYAKPFMAPALPILGHNEEHISNDSFGEFHFSPTSLLLNKPQDFNSILDSGLLSYQKSQFRKYVYKYNEEMDTNFNHTALSLSHRKHYFKDDTSCVQDSIYLPPYHHWVREAVSSDYHHHHQPDTEAWLSSSPRCLSLTDSHSNYQSSISKILQLPQSIIMPSPFHIDDNYEPKINGGDEEEVLYHFSETMVEIYNSSFLHMPMQRDNGCLFSLDNGDNINELEETHEMFL